MVLESMTGMQVLVTGSGKGQGGSDGYKNQQGERVHKGVHSVLAGPTRTSLGEREKKRREENNDCFALLDLTVIT